MTGPQPRAHQQAAIEAIQASLATGPRATALLACGTGKTLTGLCCLAQRRDGAADSGRLLVIGPGETLAQALQSRFTDVRLVDAVDGDGPSRVYPPGAFQSSPRCGTELRSTTAIRSAGCLVVTVTGEPAPLGG